MDTRSNRPSSATEHTQHDDESFGLEYGRNKQIGDRLEQAPRRRMRYGWKSIALHFNPIWFTTTMGTGIVATLLNRLPYNAQWLYWISVVIYCINILLFLTCTVITVVRYCLFRGMLRYVLSEPDQSLHFATAPIGLGTLVNLTAFICVPSFGHWAVVLTWVLWWVQAFLAVTCCISLLFIVMSVHQTKLETFTAAWLLPTISIVVCAASGAVVTTHLPNPEHALWTLLISYVLWGMSLPLAFIILAMYFQRLFIFSLPPREIMVSVFLPLGPLGQGSYGMILLGREAMRIMPLTNTLVPGAGTMLYVVGWLVGMVLWAFALVWLFFAIATIWKRRFPFNLSWWGFTFPLGVVALATNQIALELPSLFFKILSTILSLIVVLLWILVSIKTIVMLALGNAPADKAAEKWKQEHPQRDIELQTRKAEV